MSATVILGAGLGLLCALLSDLSGFMKYRGAIRCRPVTLARPLSSGRSLLQSRPFRYGLALSVVAWGLHVGALALAPLSLVQVCLASSMVGLGVLGRRFYKLPVGGRQARGLFLLTAALLLLALSEPVLHSAHSRFSPPALIAFEAALVAVGSGLVVSPACRRVRGHGLLLGVSAGLLFAVSDIALKALAGISLAHGPLSLLTSPWLALAVATAVLSFYASAASLQQGEPVAVLALTATAMNGATILAGLLVFGDPLPHSVAGLAAQVAGFALLLGACALVPSLGGGAAADAAAW